MLNLDKNKRYLLACSFGPDSMALFGMLLAEGYNFDVAHVNYHLREESNNEQQSLEQFCFNKKIKLFVLDSYLIPKRNVEATCREIRYSFFAKIFKHNHYDALLVAHHQDDLIETYILQKQRKNLVKYFGIAEKTSIKGMTVLRPLLGFKKKECEDYCSKENIPFSIDKTNLEPIYQRNKIRLVLIPNLTDEKRSDILEEIKSKNREVEIIYNRINNISNKIDALNKLSDKEFAYYLFNKIQNINCNFAITYKQSLEVRKILRSEKPNIQVSACHYQVIIEKAYDSLNVYENKTTDYCYEIEKPCVIDNAILYADLVSDKNNRNIRPLDYPLTIRNAKYGDKYRIKNYHVLVRRLFIDWKMPVHLRRLWPVILNKEGKIIYIPRYQKDFKVDSNTKFYVKECFTLK